MQKFNFTVTIGKLQIQFTEVTGLNNETQPIAYRHGDSANFTATKIPGIKKYSTISFKRGILKGDSTEYFYTYLKNSTTEKTNIIISLFDEANTKVASWTAVNAYVVKITGPTNVIGNEMAIEEIEMAHEGLTIIPVN